jgi:hypothetical protein
MVGTDNEDHRCDASLVETKKAHFQLADDALLDVEEAALSLFTLDAGGSDLGGYSHIVLDWVSRWSDETRERILVEKRAQLDIGAARSSQLRRCLRMRQYLPSPSSRLLYAATHSAWHDIPKWVSDLSLEGTSVGGTGRFLCPENCEGVKHATSGRSTFDRKSKYPMTPRLQKQILMALPLCSDFLRGLVVEELANRGIFLPPRALLLAKTVTRAASRGRSSELTQAATDLSRCMNIGGEKERLMTLLHRLGRSGFLCAELNNSIVSLENVLPRRKLSAFHRFFVRMCIKQQLFHVLREYTRFYELGMATTEKTGSCCFEGKGVSLAELRSSVVCADVNWEPWAGMLFSGRLGTASAIFEAAQQNALFCGSSPDPAEMLLEGRILQGLGTLMFAPVDNTLKRGQLRLIRENSVHGAPKALLSKCTEDWPLLQEALVGKHKNIAKLEASGASTDDSAVIARGDVALLDLLDDSVPFRLDLLQDDRDPNDKKQNLDPHFSCPSLRDSAYIENLGVAYYLSKGRPLQAFHHIFSSLEPGVRMRMVSGEDRPKLYLLRDGCDDKVGAAEILLKLARRVALSHVEHHEDENVALDGSVEVDSDQNVQGKGAVLAACTSFLHIC